MFYTYVNVVNVPVPASESLQYNRHQNLIKAFYIFAKLSGSLTVLTRPEEYFK